MCRLAHVNEKFGNNVSPAAATTTGTIITTSSFASSSGVLNAVVGVGNNNTTTVITTEEEDEEDEEEDHILKVDHFTDINLICYCLFWPGRRNIFYLRIMQFKFLIN